MNNLRIVPLGGGPGMVTNNMYVYLYGNDALIVDCGIGFPEDKISDDILIPDITYLKQNQFNIRAVILTHGHDDHYAALPHILPELNYPPVYASRLTAGFCQARLKDFDISHQVTVIKENDQLTLGPFTVFPIHITHSVPDCFHYLIKTPIGAVYHGSDFKFDLSPIDNWPPNFQKIVSLSKEGILCLLSDCLRSERPGFSMSESTLAIAIDREMVDCPGRFIFTTMSSQIHRIQQAVDMAVSHNRQVIFIGRSMEKNAAIAGRLGFLRLPQKSVANKRQLKKIPDHRLCLIIAGSQGQESSSLTRYASGQHPLIKVKTTDKVIYSTDIIPGNEQSVYHVIDELSLAGANVVYGEMGDDLHVSGHGSAEELKLLMQLVRPKFLYPIGGTFRHARQYQRLALNQGFKSQQVILPQSGQIVDLTPDGRYELKEKLPLKEIRFNQNV
ncbi:MAG: ribonuclease J [Patescibacteria group bacterium]